MSRKHRVTAPGCAPPFAFEGKGAAGGHSATHKATAEPTRPQPVE
ncbi:hypothetical protein LNP05_13305 [Klebsiella pneumoniae subsp. pneumoniae]|nr:hypothetical protein [Klebsiella pneumoniae subsp. pneumoniae]